MPPISNVNPRGNQFPRYTLGSSMNGAALPLLARIPKLPKKATAPGPTSIDSSRT